jgi:hypothetical protein
MFKNGFSIVFVVGLGGFDRMDRIVVYYREKKGRESDGMRSSKAFLESVFRFRYRVQSCIVCLC